MKKKGMGKALNGVFALLTIFVLFRYSGHEWMINELNVWVHAFSFAVIEICSSDEIQSLSCIGAVSTPLEVVTPVLDWSE